VFGLLLLLGDNISRFQISLLLFLGMMALIVDAARQLVDTERVIDVMRVGTNRLVVSGGHHYC